MSTKFATIVLAVNHGKLSKLHDAMPVEGTVNALSLAFQFKTSDWDDTTRTAVFLTNINKPEEAVGVLLDENNECNIPASILSKSGKFLIGVFGANTGYRIVSEWIQYDTRRGCFTTPGIPVAPTPTAYEQMLAMILQKQDIISDLASIRDGAAKGKTAYQKPSTGIVKNDLENTVKESLGKADTALQEIPIASTTQLGGIKIGNGLKILNGVLSLDIDYINDIIIRDAGSVLEGM